METIKLLIWDLDETFWKGVLSDGEVTAIPENIELVKRLTDRGIVNSICSKNDYEKTKAKLEELGVWDYFVFPSIDWTSKGERVKNIISDMNLRPVNCLFIDDNVNNLEEVKFSSGGGINVTLPDKLPELVKDPAFTGKDDNDHSRLNQYKVLEKKVEARAQSGSNEEFLYQSEIYVELIEDCSDKLVRIYEMIHRNNQLNFTKDRISQEEVDIIFSDPNIISGVVHVKDKYGDHGIVGCYAVKDGKALQFVFSCRILGMGVEQWVYAELGYPEINVVGEVAAQLNKIDKPKWINQSNVRSYTNIKSEINECQRLIIYGACPLRPVAAYLQPRLSNFKFADISPTPCCLNIAVTIRESDEIKNEWLSRVNTINDAYTFDKDVYNSDTGFILITLLGIEHMRKYKSKKRALIFILCSLLIKEEDVDSSFFSEYSPIEISSDDIFNELAYVCEHLSEKTKLLIQTVPEVEFPEFGQDISFFHRIEQNKIIEKLALKYECVNLIDIRKYAKISTDFFDPLPQHYNRNIAQLLAEDVLDIIGISNRKSNITSNDQKIIPQNAVIQEFEITNMTDKCIVTTYILNGIIYRY